MNTRKKSNAVKYMESLRGGPLTFGRLLHSIRICDEISQTQLADMMGMSRSNICDIEKDRRAVTIEKAAQFAKALGYSENQFIATVIEDQLRQAGIPLMVELKKAA
jgi:transcriptional regulator with XRE-family HTH domain